MQRSRQGCMQQTAGRCTCGTAPVAAGRTTAVAVVSAVNGMAGPAAAALPVTGASMGDGLGAGAGVSEGSSAGVTAATSTARLVTAGVTAAAGAGAAVAAGPAVA